MKPAPPAWQPYLTGSGAPVELQCAVAAGGCGRVKAAGQPIAGWSWRRRNGNGRTWLTATESLCADCRLTASAPAPA